MYKRVFVGVSFELNIALIIIFIFECVTVKFQLLFYVLCGIFSCFAKCSSVICCAVENINMCSFVPGIKASQIFLPCIFPTRRVSSLRPFEVDNTPLLRTTGGARTRYKIFSKWNGFKITNTTRSK